MKTLITAALFTLVAGAAQAEVKIETRATHSYLRLDADNSYGYVDGVYDPTSYESVSPGYHNTAGAGLAVIFHADETAEVGLGYERADYHPYPKDTITQQTLSAFSRIHVLQPGAFKLYGLAGISRHELSENVRGELPLKVYITPILNYDFGLGTSYRVGIVDLGFEYKFSNTLGTGTASTKFVAGGTEYKTKITEVKIENHSGAFTLGVKL